MKFVTTALATAAVAAAGTSTGPIAAAEGPTTQPIGTQGIVSEGGTVSGWTVADLKPSSDVLPYQPRGTLWEATATDEAIQGTTIPIVANLSARSAGEQNYQALFTVPTVQGIAPASLAPGQKTTGKVYFDVTGDAPTSVVYQIDGSELLRWEAPTSQSPAASGADPQASVPVVRPARPGPAPRPAPTPPQLGSPSTPSVPNSAGTPLPESAGTPLPDDTPATGGSGGSTGTSSIP